MAEALISVLLEQLASVVYQHTSKAVKLVLNADKDVKSFSSKLKAIQAVLEDAEKKQVMEARVAHWLEKLKDVSYEMDDVLDEWNTQLLRQQVEEEQEAGDDAIVTKKKVCFSMPSGCFCFGQVNKVIHHHNIAKRIKELNERLTLIAVEREMYGFNESTKGGHGDEQLIQRKKTSSLVDISLIFGREEEKKNLLSKLLTESNQDGERFLVIPIVGMGGMGKTTLTQLVYNNDSVAAHYDKKVWVCVSDPFNEINVAKAIIENLDEMKSNLDELDTLLQYIKTRVENKKLLLVLDDVWTEDILKWENLNLRVIMKSCAKGSTILVTTRKEGVAKMVGGTSNMIHLDKLSDSDSIALFNSIAFLDREEDESSEFRSVGEKIVKKCEGLPLAVKTLGSLVRYKKTRREWQDVLNSQIWELKEVEHQVFRPLLLSYYDLTSALKRCLLYCVIFPKDYKLQKNNLIELWMSQDYLNSKENKPNRSVGEDYFNSLAMWSFFQDFEKDDMGNVCGCKMHDIVHDFVQFLSKKECIIIEGVEGGNERVELAGGDKVRHLTFTEVKASQLPLANYKKIRTLSLLGSETTTISPGSLLQLKCLRTLKLCLKMRELPEEIGELIHLRCMDLSESRTLKILPEAVCDLCNLQTLDLRYCWQLEKLPKAMGKLINLKHLYVWRCDRVRYLPKGIRSLKRLQVLDKFIVSEDEDVEALKLRDLGSMDQLQGSLEIQSLGKKEDDGSEIEKAKLRNKEHLSELIVWFHPRGEERQCDSKIVKEMQPHPNLESISIWHCHISTSESLYWINSLHNLRRVCFFYWSYLEVLPPLGKLWSLEILEIYYVDKVKKVGVEFLASETGILFPKLKTLQFGNMPSWEEWEGITKVDSSEINIMPRLSELRIEGCPKLKALPDFLYKITTLQTLQIKACSILEREYEKGVGKEWHNISHILNITIQSD